MTDAVTRVHIVLDVEEGEIQGVFRERKYAELMVSQWNEGRTTPLYEYVGSWTIDALVPMLEAAGMTTPSAQAAAQAGQQTREQAIQNAWSAMTYDIRLAAKAIPLHPGMFTQENVKDCRTALTACLAHLDEIERHLPREAFDESQRIGPDVAVRGFR